MTDTTLIENEIKKNIEKLNSELLINKRRLDMEKTEIGYNLYYQEKGNSFIYQLQTNAPLNDLNHFINGIIVGTIITKPITQ